ncbi:MULTISPECIES: glucose-6-phosphate isomerase [Pacificibacter]|uniref:glucose-6-phosphate isomerase n=1 Tax=Pacificibacter TaxID=1042323 RepID=UPI001C097F14|nr:MULTISPECIES: glucose-6-phosphate isomerase [Pacificibacter]MBU2936886.1 glucose-6-phosphate isomerase [Pacificibacter marinus]MDO6614880.1 glucose-6-phosphate isomerase [Pacificibacter sp. 1_MG-2023]
MSVDFSGLKALNAAAADRHILDLFADDAVRARSFSVEADGLLFDYSKTNIDAAQKTALIDLLEQADVAGKRDAMFSGEKINDTEGRAVLHTALRNLDGDDITVDGAGIMKDVRHVLARMDDFADRVRRGDITSSSNAPFENIVNIGIGGSDLGPVMAYEALRPYADGPQCHFVSNVDGAHIYDVLKGLNPLTTLVIVASKTFTTIETMTNAQTARDWLVEHVGEEGISRHFAALSTARDKTAAFGVDPDLVFGFEDWVGGRYSVWGPIGLPLMLAIGPQHFADFLRGAQAMDTHFRTATWGENLPALLALTGIWHNQVCGHATRAVLPYEQRLVRLPAYLQQLEMESNGKRVSMDGEDLPFESGPVVWGEPGTNGQHAFYQLIHQGTRVVPCEFMVGKYGHEAGLEHQHELLVSNCLAQSEALLRGRSLDEARAIMRAKGFEGAELERQARHRVFPGNRPTTTLAYERLTPFVLGQIVALYEHRVFVEGVVLGINSFDQWGVELGKELAVALQPVLAGAEDGADKDGSTRNLVKFLQV